MPTMQEVIQDLFDQLTNANAEITQLQFERSLLLQVVAPFAAYYGVMKDQGVLAGFGDNETIPNVRTAGQRSIVPRIQDYRLAWELAQKLEAGDAE